MCVLNEERPVQLFTWPAVGQHGTLAGGCGSEAAEKPLPPQALSLGFSAIALGCWASLGRRLKG